MIKQWDVNILKAIDRLILMGDRERLAKERVIDAGADYHPTAGEYWVRASVHRNILEDLGRDPTAMTRREYLWQGSAFVALTAAAIFENEVKAERARSMPYHHRAALEQMKVDGYAN